MLVVKEKIDGEIYIDIRLTEEEVKGIKECFIISEQVYIDNKLFNIGVMKNLKDQIEEDLDELEL